MLFNFVWDENVFGVERKKRKQSRCQESVTYVEFGLRVLGIDILVLLWEFRHIFCMK